MKENYRNLINHLKRKASFQSEFCSHSAQCLPPLLSKHSAFRVRDEGQEGPRLSQTAGLTAELAWAPGRSALDVHAPPAVSGDPSTENWGGLGASLQPGH